MAKQLKGYDEIFAVDEPSQPASEQTPVTLSLDQLKPYHNGVFKLYKGERLDDMVNSIKTHGVLQPILVRDLEDESFFEILAGHNRVNAAKLAGLKEIAGYILKNISDEAAEVYYFETNLMQRSFTDLTHSEKAAVLAAHQAKMFSQGKRSDIIKELEAMEKLDDSITDEAAAEIKNKIRNNEKLAEEYGLSKNSVARYLRINKLNDELKRLVDENTIPLNAGVDLSYLSEDEQLKTYLLIDEHGYKVDLAKAGLLKRYAMKRELTEAMIQDILSGKTTRKPKAQGLRDCKVKSEVLRKYFPENAKPKEIEETIQKALELYFAQAV